MDDKKIGQPMGVPENRGEGDADPQHAGAEGGLGFLGDQRNDAGPVRRQEKEEPPLDGTLSREHIQGDEEDKVSARTMREFAWDGPRLSMDLRKREPLIIW